MAPSPWNPGTCRQSQTQEQAWSRLDWEPCDQTQLQASAWTPKIVPQATILSEMPLGKSVKWALDAGSSRR